MPKIVSDLRVHLRTVFFRTLPVAAPKWEMEEVEKSKLRKQCKCPEAATKDTL